MEVETSQKDLIPYTMYGIQRGHNNARCCYESQLTKIIVSTVGPQFDAKYSGQIPHITITINGYPKETSLFFERIKDILLKCINVADYQKAIFKFHVEVLQHEQNTLFSCLVNLFCFTCIQAGITLLDVFSAATVFAVQPPNKTLEIGFVPPNSTTTPYSFVQLVLLKRSKNSVHINCQGQMNIFQLQKMLSLARGASEIVEKYLQKLLLNE